MPSPHSPTGRTDAEEDLGHSGADPVGRTLGDFVVLRRLGRGGMADVYLAEQKSLQRQLALKVLKPELARDPTHVRRFLQEARAAARLVHPNIVQIYEAGTISGLHYIAQEYVPGGSLRQWMAANSKPISASSAIAIMRQVASALHKAASEGIIHRDIKPDNILLTRSGEAKVADFGLARSISAASLELTQFGTTMGTPLYMSPEQSAGRSIDTRSDLYSCGVTSYQLLAGSPPFVGENALAVAMQHANMPAPPLHAWRPELPKELCEIVHKLLAKKPEDRFSSGGELLVELRKIGQQKEGESGSVFLADWTPPELLAMSDATHVATRELQTWMRFGSSKVQSRVPWLVAGLMVMVAFGVGRHLANRSKPVPLLHLDPEKKPEIKRMETAELQYYYAADFANTEEAWLAIERYFPAKGADAQTKHFLLLGKAGLADLYMSQTRLNEAMAIYQELSGAEPRETRILAKGTAGQALVHAAKGEVDQAKPLIAQLRDKWELLDEPTRKRIGDLTEKLKNDGAR